MRKKSIPILLTVLFIQLGCNNDDIGYSKNCDSFSICSYTVYKQSTIEDSTRVIHEFDESDSLKETWTNFEIKKGKKNVFEYKTIPKPEIRDGKSRSIVFEVDSVINSFLFQDKELGEIKTIYQDFCGGVCMGSVSRKIEKGKIEGKRINSNRWSINIVLPMEIVDTDSTKYEYEIKVSETFFVK